MVTGDAKRAKKTDRKIVSAFLDTKDKRFFEEHRKLLNAGRGALKCGAVAHSSAEAQRLVAELTQRAVDRLRRGILESREFPSEEALQDLFKELDKLVEVSKAASFIADHSARGVVDAVARSNRSLLQAFRLRALRFLLKRSSEVEQSEVERQMALLPVTPASLYGGRLFNAVNKVGLVGDARENLQRQTRDLGLSEGFALGGARKSSKKDSSSKKKKSFRKGRGGRRKRRNNNHSGKQQQQQSSGTNWQQLQQQQRGKQPSAGGGNTSKPAQPRGGGGNSTNPKPTKGRGKSLSLIHI